MAQQSREPTLPGDRPLDEVLERVASLSAARLDAAVLALASWSLFGVLLDVRNHGQGASFALEGFLTVPHTIFYSGFAGIAVLLVAVVYANRRAGASRKESVPVGYRLGLVGVGIFGLGGPGDALWHATFSAEQGVEALTSPTHLMLATGAVLFLSSPLRAAHAREENGLLGRATAGVSATYVLASITIITLYSHPVADPHAMRAAGDVAKMNLGVTGIMLHAAVLSGLAVVLVREFDVVPGTFTFMLLIDGIAMTWVGQSYVLLPGMVLAGVVADGLLVTLDPSAERPRHLRVFAAAVPAVVYAFYFVSIALAATIVWPVHTWAGAVVLAGFAGLLVSYVSLPSSRAAAA
jgi:hypothetical protein